MGAEQKLPDKERLFCPYCDEEMAEITSYCQACGVTAFYCPNCRKAVPRDKRVCPYCGTEIKGEKT
ncbi:MAG: zinc ribbon domain-containing protein [Desulfatiglandales bacterium]